MRFSFALLIGVLLSFTAKAEDYSAELSALSMVESSGGQNTEHPVLASGMHAGTRAGGYYGIMPKTARETLERNPKLFARYARFIAATNNDVTSALNRDREFDQKLAAFMWAKLRKTMTREQAACAWFRGAYADVCFDNQEIANDPYVQKFSSHMNRIAYEHETHR